MTASLDLALMHIEGMSLPVKTVDAAQANDQWPHQALFLLEVRCGA